MNILVVEDEVSIRDVLKSYFLKEGWDVFTSSNGMDALQKIRKFKIDLVVLDLMIPKLSGEEVCREIRRNSNVPVLIISAKSREEDMINGLEIGADDYITKPFRIKEVMARINALIRRIEMFTQERQKVLSFNHNRLVINFESKEVLVDNKVVSLTFTEFKLLDVLVKNRVKCLADRIYRIRFKDIDILETAVRWMHI